MKTFFKHRALMTLAADCFVSTLTSAGLKASMVMKSMSLAVLILAGIFADGLGLAAVAGPGDVDQSFVSDYAHQSGADPADVRAIALQPDGKVLIGGGFYLVGASNRPGIARLNPDGSLDTAFDPGTGAMNSYGFAGVNAIALQSDGRVLIGGDFTNYNGVARNGVARLNADGSLDPGFNPGNGAFVVRALLLQADGKLVIGGSFTSYNATSRTNIARINPDGSLDTSFDPGAAFQTYDTVSALALQPDGKILFATDNSVVGRFNTNGSPDTDFNAPFFDSTIDSLALQPDGKVLVGGGFGNVLVGAAIVPRNAMVRLNNDGMLDNTFGAAIGSDYHSVMAIALQPDGKVSIGGFFTTVGGTNRSGIARLNSDGSLDLGFDPGTGVGSPFYQVSCLALQPDGKILIGGTFYQVNGMARIGIARLYGDLPSLTIIPSKRNVILTWPTWSAGFTLESATNLSPFAIWVTNSPAPVLVNGQNAVTNPITAPQQFFRLKQ